MKIAKLTADKLGIIASALCMIHCIATPFIFIARSCASTCCESAPGWWRGIDTLFLLISFYAIYLSSKNTTKNWMKVAMWTTWTLLLIIIVNENFNLFVLDKHAIYFPAVMLVALHFYNLKFCQCKTDTCCIH